MRFRGEDQRKLGDGDDAGLRHHRVPRAPHASGGPCPDTKTVSRGVRQMAGRQDILRDPDGSPHARGDGARCPHGLRRGREAGHRRLRRLPRLAGQEAGGGRGARTEPHGPANEDAVPPPSGRTGCCLRLPSSHGRGCGVRRVLHPSGRPVTGRGRRQGTLDRPARLHSSHRRRRLHRKRLGMPRP